MKGKASRQEAFGGHRGITWGRARRVSRERQCRRAMAKTSREIRSGRAREMGADLSGTWGRRGIHASLKQSVNSEACTGDLMVRNRRVL